MRRVSLLVAAAAMTVLGAMPASAHATGPCVDSGGPGHSDYARHHIKNATAGGDHVPGTHGGYSLCLETGRSVHKP